MNTDNLLKCHSERREGPSVAASSSSGPSAGGYHSGFFAALRMTVVGMCLLSGLSLADAAQRDMRPSVRKVRDEVRAVVEAQVAALQTGDFATAYEFAGRGIKRQFDQRLFAALIRRGYPALLRPGQREFGVVRDDGAGTAEITVAITDAQKRTTVYRYLLALEEDLWRIGAVILEQRPPRGDI